MRFTRGSKIIGIALAMVLLPTAAFGAVWVATTTSVGSSNTAADITATDATPTNLRCAGWTSDTQANLTWNAATNSAVQGYEMAAKSGTGGSFNQLTTVNGRTTSSGVAAYNGNGASTFFNLRSTSGVNWRGNLLSYDISSHSCPRYINTIAGPIADGTNAAGGFVDNTSARNARFNNPSGLYFDHINDLLYIADTGNNRIRVVTGATGSNPQVKTIAGTGTASFSGDGGNATAATLDGPTAIIFLNISGTGALYVADTNNNRIRKITPSSGVVGNAATNTITTVAGDGNAGTGGGGGDGVNNGATASGTNLSAPQGITTGAANQIVISDTGHNRVRILNTSTNTITAHFGSTSGTAGYQTGTGSAALLNSPRSIYCTASPSCYFADTGNSKIRFANSSGAVNPYGQNNNTAGNSGDYVNSANVQTNTPLSVANDNTGGVLVADSGNNRLRHISNATDRWVFPLAGDPGGTAGATGENVLGSNALMTNPRALYMTQGGTNLGDLWVAEGNRIRRMSKLPNTVYNVMTSQVPGGALSNDGTTYELGMTFRSSQAGTVIGVRYYSMPQQVTGTPIGHLWAVGNTTPLATVTFPAFNGTSGWKTAYFPTPVSIPANTNYIISYYCPNGQYPYIGGGFTAGITNGPLTAEAGGGSPGNGLFVSGAPAGGAYPTSGSGPKHNYLIDVLFQ